MLLPFLRRPCFAYAPRFVAVGNSDNQGEACRRHDIDSLVEQDARYLRRMVSLQLPCVLAISEVCGRYDYRACLLQQKWTVDC